MQDEGQNQIIEMPKTGPQTDSDKSKAKHAKRGGKRPGAGRKPNAANIVLKGTTRATLLGALENVDPQLVAVRITKLLNSKREVIWLQTLNFIYDRILGKPKQDVNVSGAFLHAEIRDPVLMGWPREALAKLANRYDEVFLETAREFGLNVAQDGPQNQIESKPAIEAEKPAIEAEVVESESDGPSFVTRIEKLLGSPIPPAESESEAFKLLGPSRARLLGVITHPPSNAGHAPVAETAGAVPSLFLVAGDASVLEEVSPPRASDMNEFGQKAQQFLLCFVVDTPDVEDEQLFNGSCIRL
jgi:hypothetical protein